MRNPNLELLELAAERLRQLLPEIVFVGGCATGLLIDDPAAAPVRGTYDVDIIAEIGSYAEYTVFSERLRGLGFKEDSREGAPRCRWTHGALTLDVMPLDSQVLGFSNRWYPDALRTAGNVQLPSSCSFDPSMRLTFSGPSSKRSTDAASEISSRAMTWKISLPSSMAGHR
jgi:hypothetical protein